MKTDYADKTYLTADLENLEENWKEYNIAVKIGKVAAVIIIVIFTSALSFIYSTGNPVHSVTSVTSYKVGASQEYNLPTGER
jgi:hypothetical protein